MAAETPDPYKDWIDDFDHDVEKILQSTGGPSLAPARDAVSDFNSWWRTEVPDTGEEPELSFESEKLNKELELSRKEAHMLKAQLEILQKDPDTNALGALRKNLDEALRERNLLREKIMQVVGENRNLRERTDRIKTDISGLRIKMSRAQDGYEGRIHQLEEDLNHWKDKTESLKEGKVFLEREHARLIEKLESAEKTIHEAQTEATRAFREKETIEHSLADLKRRLIEKEAARAAMESAVAELREQATSLRERFIRSNEKTPTAHTIGPEDLQKISELEELLVAGQKESEAKVRETTRYLEMKIREIHDENKDQFGQFRELLDALVRFRGGAR